MRNALVGMLLFGVSLVAGCHRPAKSDVSPPCKVTVFAASSLSDLAEVIRRDFVSDHPSCSVTFNFGASNTLGLQIEAGAHADVFLSAAAGPVDHLLAIRKNEAGPKTVLLSNCLALISNTLSSLDIKDACALKDANVERVALGQPDAVPAGMYARAYLSKLKCADGQSAWSSLEGRLLPMPNVRAVLSVVEQQPTLVGFVYRTDAMMSKAVKTQFIVQGTDAPRIDYYGVGLGPKNQRKMAEEFLSEFSKQRVQDSIREMGFAIDKS